MNPARLRSRVVEVCLELRAIAPTIEASKAARTAGCACRVSHTRVLGCFT
ncbi:hypothetical protein BTZ20_0009 [Rhodococcus sp. MTM3W5.2]|nr:hypothetical protein BTZ20_0009 [Rhodococcus sp. MTM3W5.2]